MEKGILKGLVKEKKKGKYGVLVFGLVLLFFISGVVATQCSVPMGTEEYEQYTCDSSESNYQELLKQYGGGSAGCSKCTGKSADELYTKSKESHSDDEIWTSVQDNGKLYGDLKDETNKDGFAEAGLKNIHDKKLYDKVWKENDKDEVIRRLEKIADQKKKENEFGQFLTHVFNEIETKVDSNSLTHVTSMSYKQGEQDIEIHFDNGETIPLSEESKMPKDQIDKITIGYDDNKRDGFVRFEKDGEYKLELFQGDVLATDKESLSFEGAKGKDVSPNTEYDLTDLKGRMDVYKDGTIYFWDNGDFVLEDSEATLVFLDNSRGTVYPHVGQREFFSLFTGGVIGVGTGYTRYNVNVLSDDTFVGENFDVSKDNLYTAEVKGAGTVGSMAEKGHGAKIVINGNVVTPIMSEDGSVKFTPRDGNVWTVQAIEGKVKGIKGSQTYNVDSGESLMLSSSGYANPRRSEGDLNAYVRASRVLEAGLSAGAPSVLLSKIQNDIAQITKVGGRIMVSSDSYQSSGLNMNSVSRNVRIALEEVGRI
jgi:hypothetical protein